MATPTLPIERPTVDQGDSSSHAIVFDSVSLAFEENVVLDGVSFHLPHGETKALFGIAGSGKSTILKLAMGLLPPDSGRIFLLGHEVTRMSEQELFELRRRVGIVFQESALFDSLTVAENVAYPLEKIAPGIIRRQSVSQAWPPNGFQKVDDYTDRADTLNGRKVQLIGADGRRFNYIITAFYRIKDSGVALEQRQNNGKWMDPTKQAQLTITTCWPPWSNTHRLVVVASPAP